MRSPGQVKGLNDMLRDDTPDVIAVCSGKGGVGKTNVAANLAIALGQSGRHVQLLDADLGLANIDVLLGLQPRMNLAHVVAGEAVLEDVFVRGPAGVDIVPASSGNFDMTDLCPAEHAAIVKSFADLERVPDVLVVDTAAGIAPAVARFVAAAQHAFVVVCDEPASITDSYALIKVFSRHYGVRRFNIVTNQSRAPRAGADLFDKLVRVADAYLDVALVHAGDIPLDARLVKAVQEQRAVVEAYPGSPASLAFRALAERAGKLPRPRGLSGGIEFFLERLLAGGAAAGEVSA